MQPYAPSIGEVGGIRCLPGNAVDSRHTTAVGCGGPPGDLSGNAWRQVALGGTPSSTPSDYV